MISTVLIIPAHLSSAADQISNAMGWGPSNYTVPLSTEEFGPITHYGCRADSELSFIEMLQNPPVIEGVPAENISYVLNELISDFYPSPVPLADGVEAVTYPSAEAHFMAVLTANGLHRV